MPTKVEVKPSLVIEAFEAVSGDTSGARAAASEFSSPAAWGTWQGTQAAGAGAAALALPGAHIPALAADLAFLMRKLAFCTWGVGFLHGCTVDGKGDLANVLGLWSGVVTKDMLVTAASGTAVVATLAHPAFAGAVAGAALNAVAQGAAVKVGAKTALGLGQNFAPKLIEKASLKLAQKIGAKMAAKAGFGFIPFVGPCVGAGINGWFTYRIYESANEYYGHSPESERGLS